MEVIPLIRSSGTGSETSNGDNGIKRHVQEWSRLDRLTGILEHARVEADQWTNHTANSKHKYGKVVDRRARNLADGSKEQTQQTKQLEVFQTHTAGCSVQVIRSQTSTTSSWHNSNAGSSAFQWPSSIFDKKDDDQFDQLRSEYSPLDVSSQKNKATVARSGSIGARRPPTRRPARATPQLPTLLVSDGRAPAGPDRSEGCSTDEMRGDGADGTDGTDEPPPPLDRSSRSRRSLQSERRRDAVGELEDVLEKVLGKKNGRAVNGLVSDGSPPTRPPAAKKPSFVTVENLKTTKNKLRRLNGSRDADADDGIVTDSGPAGGDSRSLDYRGGGGGGGGTAKTEEWYDRRKSYGFERVLQRVPCESDGAAAAATQSVVDSSTDSGICRSTETGLSNSSRQSSVDRESIADLVKRYSAKEADNDGGGGAHAYNTTMVAKGRILEAINSLRSRSSAYFDAVVKPADAAVSKECDDRDKERVYTRRLSVGTDTAAAAAADKDDVPKRHSIAAVTEAAAADKKNGNKKVEFCRTEVHFDTTPGKINIVDMDDKPAAGQSYRPRKRYGRPAEKSDRRGLPVYRFGDDVQRPQRHGEDEVPVDGGDDGDETVCDAADQPKGILKRRQGAEDAGGVACDNGIEVRISSTESTPVDCRRASWSVADRVKQVEAVGLSTRVNFTEGETTAVGFDPADPPPARHRHHHRYSYDGTASPPVWCHDDDDDDHTGQSAATDTSAKCHEKLLVRIGACRAVAAGAVNADLRAFSECFGGGHGGHGTSAKQERLSSGTRDRPRKTSGASWPRHGRNTYPAPAAPRKCDRPPMGGADAVGMPDVIGALDDLGKTIDEQMVRHRRGAADSHVTLIEVRQPSDARTVRGRLEYVKDLMSTDETSEESLKADEEVRSYMAAADCTDDDVSAAPACENLKKLVSAAAKNVGRQSHRSRQENRRKNVDVKSYESTLVIPNVTSVLLNHEEKTLEPERSQFRPVPGVHAAQATSVLKHRFERVLQKQPSKRVPVKIVQDNRKNKPKPEISRTEVPAVTKLCAAVSLKQVPMTVQPKPVCNEKKKPEKKESVYGNIGYRGNSLRVKDKPAAAAAASAANKQVQDLFNTGRDSWLNMPKDLGPKLNKSKACTTYKSRGRKEETVDSEVSVLEELNKAADEILKAVNGYTDDESLHPHGGEESRPRPGGNSEARSKNKKKAARLLQRANSREALLHLDEVSSSDGEAVDDVQRVKPKMQRKTKAQQQTAANSVANKTTASFAKKVQSRAQNATRPTNVQHKVHPTYYGNVSSSCTQPSAKFRDKPSADSTTKQVVDQKDTRGGGRYQCKITARTFNSKKTKCSVEENKNSIKGC